MSEKTEKTYDVENVTAVDDEISATDNHAIKGEITHMEESVDDVGYKRQITGRQVLMITFGAGIGAGFWVGMGTALKNGGPFGIVFGYAIVTFIVWVMFIQVGEMTACQPIHGGFINQDLLYMDGAWAFATGINFVINWMTVLAYELTGAISICQYWDTNGALTTAEYIVIFGVIYGVCNIWPVKAYGYIEYCQSFIKVLSMAGITIFMLVATCGGLPDTGPIGFKFWKNPGWVRNGIKGIIYAISQASGSFGGGEHIAVVAGEVKHPRKFIPRCTKPIFWRMAIFFMGNSWLITMNVPFDDENLNNASGTLTSPYVITMMRGGVKILPDILNVIILLSVISCGNTSIYICSRSLVGLSDLKLIHPIFGKKDKKGRPWYSLILSYVCGMGLAFLNCSSTGVQIFNWFNSLVALNGYFTWLSIYFAHFRFRKGLKVQGFDFRKFKIYDRFFPWTTYLGTFVIMVLFIAQFYIAIWPLDDAGMSAGTRTENFFLTYLCVPIFFGCWAYYKYRYHTHLVKYEDMDFHSAREWDAIEEREDALDAEKGKTTRGKFSVFCQRFLA